MQRSCSSYRSRCNRAKECTYYLRKSIKRGGNVKDSWIITCVLLVSLVSLTAWSAVRQDDAFGRPQLTARLKGFEETPAISTTGRGEFRAVIERDGTISYRLQYSIEPLPDVRATVAHIHIGQRGVAGGVVIFLWGGGGKPACPSPSGSVEGIITAADVVSLPAQGIAAGELGEVMRAIHAGVTYVNVHSTRFPAGEIRGQITDHDDVE